jgi:hypothetical protein
MSFDQKARVHKSADIIYVNVLISSNRSLPAQSGSSRAARSNARPINKCLSTMRFLFTGKYRSIFMGNLGLFWIHLYGLF